MSPQLIEPKWVGMPRNAERIRDIEILRAVAILYVMIFHLVPHALARLAGGAGPLNVVLGLWSGVDLFFCVSGYVITRSLLSTRNAASLSEQAIPFWIRRIFRVWPGALVWVGISVVLAHEFNSTGLFGGESATARDAWAAVLNVANFHDYSCVPRHRCGALRIYWSLSLEEQFYLVFPFAVFLLRRRQLALFLVAGAAAQLWIDRPMGFQVDVPDLAWFVRTDAICLGALLAVVGDTPRFMAIKRRLTSRRPVMRIAALGLLSALALAAAPAWHFRGVTGVLAVVSALLVGLASCDADLIGPRLPGIEALLEWLGSRSYSLYLVHDVAGSIAAELRLRLSAPGGGLWAAGGGLWAAGGALLTLSCLVTFAELNFRCIETPLRRYGREIAARVRIRGHRPRLDVSDADAASRAEH